LPASFSLSWAILYRLVSTLRKNQDIEAALTDGKSPSCSEQSGSPFYSFAVFALEIGLKIWQQACINALL
jgi:hypothetical protein